MGRYSKKDGDGNENGKKAIGLYEQNDNFARTSHFFVHFIAVVASLRHETCQYHAHALIEQKISRFPETVSNPISNQDLFNNYSSSSNGL